MKDFQVEKRKVGMCSVHFWPQDGDGDALLWKRNIEADSVHRAHGLLPSSPFNYSLFPSGSADGRMSGRYKGSASDWRRISSAQNNNTATLYKYKRKAITNR